MVVIMNEEYIVVEKSLSEFQKLLNQWKHIYNFIILGMNIRETTGTIIAVIMREDKRTKITEEKIKF